MVQHNLLTRRLIVPVIANRAGIVVHHLRIQQTGVCQGTSRLTHRYASRRQQRQRIAFARPGYGKPWLHASPPRS